MNAEITFKDRSVTYDCFINDLSARITTFLKEDKGDPEYISQNKAFERFGKGNVLRWLREKKIEPCRRPGKIEYPTARLKELSRITQDYFTSTPIPRRRK